MKKGNRNLGFSLLDTTVALSIVAVLLLVGSSFKINNKKHQLNQAVEKVCSNLSLARFLSVYRQVPIKVSFNQNFCELAEFDSQNSFWVIKSRQLLEGVEVSANNSPVFYPQGTVSNLASIKVSNDSGLYLITIAITGRVKVSQID
ncbi:MAG: type II secretion system protein [Candidatus Aminicenantes bacterium]|nr:type II secretion system protein [Candidatus Aminicenantes bacterium]